MTRESQDRHRPGRQAQQPAGCPSLATSTSPVSASGVAAGRGGDRGRVVLAERRGVVFDGVDLPGLLAGAVHPDLVLQGVAAGGAFSTKVSMPSPVSRFEAASTSSVDSTSTPRWSITVAWPGSPSSSTSLSAGSVMAKFA